MKEGEPVLGGPQVPPNNAQPANPGVQPVSFATLQNAQAIQPTSPTPPTFNPNNIARETQINNLTPPRPALATPQTPPTQTFQQFSPQLPAQPIAPSMGDVIISDTLPQKSKKGLIIGVIATMLVVAGVLIALIMGGMTGIGKKSGKQNFNIFANYILYEKTDDAQELEVEATDQYALKGLAFHEHDKAKDFYALAMKYWDSFTNTYSKQDDEVVNKTNKIATKLTFLEQFAKSGLIPNDKLLEIYYNGGEEAVLEEYAKHYAGFRQDLGVFNDFMAIQDTYIGNVVQLLEIYDQEGCIVDAKEDAKCVEEKQLVNNEYYADIVDIHRETFQYVSTIENELVNDIIELDTLITKEDGDENQ